MMEDAVARNAPPDLRDLNEPSVWSVEMEQESESTDTFSSIFIPPSARRHWQPNESTPLRKDGKHNASEGASAYTFGVGDELAALTIEHWWRRRLTWVIFFFFFASVLFLVPIFIAVEEKWTYSASFYYSVQALLGIGFGDLNVDGDALKWLMIFELIGGSFFVVFLASYFLANYLSLADEEAVEMETTTTMAGYRAARIAAWSESAKTPPSTGCLSRIGFRMPSRRSRLPLSGMCRGENCLGGR